MRTHWHKQGMITQTPRDHPYDRRAGPLVKGMLGGAGMGSEMRGRISRKTSQLSSTASASHPDDIGRGQVTGQAVRKGEDAIVGGREGGGEASCVLGASSEGAKKRGVLQGARAKNVAGAVAVPWLDVTNADRLRSFDRVALESQIHSARSTRGFVQAPGNDKVPMTAREMYTWKRRPVTVTRGQLKSSHGSRRPPTRPGLHKVWESTVE